MTEVRFVFILLFITCLPLAASAQQIALITDPYWNEIIEKEIPQGIVKRIGSEIARFIRLPEQETLKINGQTIERIILNKAEMADGEAAVRRKAFGLDADMIILSPMLRTFACETASAMPEKTFFVIGDDPEPGCGADNIVNFEIDFSPAYTLAGRWAASQEGEVNVLVYTGSRRSREGLQQFKKGWNEQNPEKFLKITEITRLGDAAVKKMSEFEELAAKSGGVAVLFAGPENEAAASRLDGTPAGVLAEDAEIWSGADYRLLASIESGPAGILTSIIKSISTESYENGGMLEAGFFVFETERKKKKI